MAIGDIFKVKRFKEEIESLKSKNEALEKQVAIKLSVKQMKPLELEKNIELKRARLDELNKLEQKEQSELADVKKQVNNLKKRITDLNVEINDLENDADMSDYGLYKPIYDFSTSLEYKDALANVRERQKDLIRNKQAVRYNSSWTVNNSIVKGRKMTRNNIKAILRSFNNECTDAIKKFVTLTLIELLLELKSRLNSIIRCMRLLMFKWFLII